MRSNIFGSTARQRLGADRRTRLLVYESEARRIAQFTESSGRIEIGGDLFGYYEPGGSPLIFIAAGPGPAARRDVTHFQQDTQFQTRIFNQLASEFRMFYLGDWHSHHNLGLSEPSGSDDAKLQDLANKNRWPQLVSLILQTDNVHGRLARGISNSSAEKDSSAEPIEAFGIWWNAFHYIFSEGETSRQRVSIDFQSGESPYRKVADRISAPAETESRFQAYKQSQLGSNADAPEADLSAQPAMGGPDGQLILGLYQKVCRILAEELRSAEMEVDLEHYDSPRLIVMNGEAQVACRVNRNDRTALEIAVKSTPGEEVVVTLSCVRGSVRASDVKVMANRIMDQLVSRRERAPRK